MLVPLIFQVARCGIASLLLAFASGALADTTNSGWVSRAWQTEQGLSGNTVIGVAQTPDGFLWVATESDGLPVLWPFGLVEAAQGAVWTAASGNAARIKDGHCTVSGGRSGGESMGGHSWRWPSPREASRLRTPGAEFRRLGQRGAVGMSGRKRDEAALKRIPESQPQVVLMDIGLPGLSGNRRQCLSNLKQVGLGVSNGRLSVVFADTHAGPEKRNPREIDWWRYHSRRGWEDNEPTGL